MSTLFRTSIRPMAQRLCNDPRMSKTGEDDNALETVFATLRTQIPTATLHGVYHYDTHYMALFGGLPGSVSYKLLMLVQNSNPRLVSNIRMRAKSTTPTPSLPTSNLPTNPAAYGAAMIAAAPAAPTPSPVARITLEVTFLYHNKTQLPECGTQFASSPHDPLLGYARGAQKRQTIGVPDSFETLPVDDRLLLSNLVYIVHHMHDDLPMVYTEFEERPAKHSMSPPSSLSSSAPPGTDMQSGSPHTTSPTTVIASNTSVCTLTPITYRLRFNNLDYVDSDFIDYLTTLVGARITRLTVAPHMMELALPKSEDDDGNDGDTEADEQDDDGDNDDGGVRATKSTTHKPLQPLCIPSVRLTIYVQPVNTPIRQMYGLPDESATKDMVKQTHAPTAATLRNLNVFAMWSRLTPKRKHVAMHDETDVETDNECAHRAKRVSLRP